MRFNVRDPVLAAKIADAVSGAANAAARAAALTNLTHSGHVVRSVRATERLNTTQAIADRRTGQPYKRVKLDGNHRAELWRLPDGKLELIAISTFAAAQQWTAERLNREIPDSRPHPAAKLLMRIYKNDMLLIGPEQKRQAVRLVKLRRGEVTLAPHNEGGNLKARDSAKDDPFKYINFSASRLVAENASKLFVTPDGRVWPGDRRK